MLLGMYFYRLIKVKKLDCHKRRSNPELTLFNSDQSSQYTGLQHIELLKNIIL